MASLKKRFLTTFLVNDWIVNPEQSDVVVGPDSGGPAPPPCGVVLVVDHQLHHPHTLSPGRPARVRHSQGLSVSPEKCLRQVSPAPCPCLDGRTDLNHVGVTEVVVYSPPTGSLLWDCCVSSPGYSLRDISLLIQSLYSVEEMKRPNVL